MEYPDGIVLSCSSYSLNLNEINFFGSINPLGFVLFKRNFINKNQIKKLIIELKTNSLNPKPLIFIDQEGGKVQRLDNEEFLKFPEQKKFGDVFVKDKKRALDLAYKSSFLMGFQLHEIGIDVNFSPVCDLFFKTAHKIIGSRSFGSDPNLVYELSRAFCLGLLDAGVIPVPKHFPGHGRSKFDTHLNKSIINTSYDELCKTDLVPFDILKNSLMVMLAHIVYPNIDKEVATYSKKINNEILRKKFKFKGLILSDDISMKAINDSLVNKVKNSYNANCDVVLYCKGILEDIKEIYPYVKKIGKKEFDYFINQTKTIKVKKRNFNKFKADLLEYNLIKS